MTGHPTFTEKVLPMMSKMGQKVLEEKFFFAVYSRNIEAINSFIEKKIDPNFIHPEYGVAALHILAQRNDYVLGYHLVQYSPTNKEIKTVHGSTALHLACMLNCKRFVTMLIHNGVDLNARNRFGKTPLHLATTNEFYGIILKLLKKGASPNELDCFLETPLSICFTKTLNLLIAKTLFQHGANMSLETKRPLHIFFEAILNCQNLEHIDFITLLLENGVDVNLIEPKTGRNCLHFVALTGNLELGIYLVDKGALLDVQDQDRRNPEKVAQDHGNDIIADYFRKGYRPSNLITSLKLLNIYASKLKIKVAQRKQEEAERAKK